MFNRFVRNITIRLHFSDNGEASEHNIMTVLTSAFTSCVNDNVHDVVSDMPVGNMAGAPDALIDNLVGALFQELIAMSHLETLNSEIEQSVTDNNAPFFATRNPYFYPIHASTVSRNVLNGILQNYIQKFILNLVF